jgi:rhamnose utilization protein RhaD (predicted bifunctional aldolase and dehydrogenase)
MSKFEDIIALSHYAGMRNDIVQAGGGNTSVKLDDDVMLIKSSGYSLSDVSLEHGFSKVNIQAILRGKSLYDATISGARPSIETYLHTLTKTFTLHSHPSLVVTLLLRKHGETILKALFPDSLFIEYSIPGKELSDIIKKESNGRIPNVIFLKNHGVIVGCESALEVIEINEEILKKTADYLGVDYYPYYNQNLLSSSLRKLFNTNYFVRLSTDKNIMYLLDLLEDINIAVTPDAIIYCGKKILVIKCENYVTEEQLKNELSSYGEYAPSVAVIGKSIYICARTFKRTREIEDVLSSISQIQLLNVGQKQKFLSEKDCDYLLTWDSEKYRMRDLK